jgi:hypothetical protein
LAIRAARSGVAANPRSDAAWLALAQAYFHVGRSWEGSEGRSVTLIRFLRHVQVASALMQATTFNPDSVLAHELLAGALGERGFIDLQLHHRREQLRLLRRQPADAPGHSERLARLNEMLEQLEGAVQDSENRFLVHTSALSGNPFERARIARNLGLANKAIDTLVQSHPDLYGPKGLRLLIDLFLETGRIEEARILLDREELRRNPDALETYLLPGGVKDGVTWSYTISAYQWFDFCRCAAAGQYDRAESALVQLRERLEQEERTETAILQPVLVYRLVTEFGSSLSSIHGMDAALKREMAVERRRRVFFMSVERADAYLLSGLLHLEIGSPATAKSEMDQSLRIYDQVGKTVPILPGRPLAIRYREAIVKHER